MSTIRTCCWCRRRMSDDLGELVRHNFGPRPCKAGHTHHPLEVVFRCPRCTKRQRRAA